MHVNFFPFKPCVTSWYFKRRDDVIIPTPRTFLFDSCLPMYRWISAWDCPMTIQHIYSVFRHLPNVGLIEHFNRCGTEVGLTLQFLQKSYFCNKIWKVYFFHILSLNIVIDIVFICIHVSIFDLHFRRMGR